MPVISATIPACQATSGTVDVIKWNNTGIRLCETIYLLQQRAAALPTIGNEAMSLTELETRMLVAFIDEGVGCMSARNAEDLKDDNMTWNNADDLQAVLPDLNKQQIGAVMASLSEKGMIHDSGESARGARVSDWYASDEGIDIGFPIWESQVKGDVTK